VAFTEIQCERRDNESVSSGALSIGSPSMFCFRLGQWAKGTVSYIFTFLYIYGVCLVFANRADGFCFLSSLPRPPSDGNVWLLPVISLRLTNTISPMRACLVIHSPNSERNSNMHRVDRVLSFFSSCCNWDSPNPSPAIPTRGHTLWYSRYIPYVLCAMPCAVKTSFYSKEIWESMWLISRERPKTRFKTGFYGAWHKWSRSQNLDTGIQRKAWWISPVAFLAEARR
jgi:hypothetical protein